MRSGERLQGPVMLEAGDPCSGRCHQNPRSSFSSPFPLSKQYQNAVGQPDGATELGEELKEVSDAIPPALMIAEGFFERRSCWVKVTLNSSWISAASSRGTAQPKSLCLILPLDSFPPPSFMCLQPIERQPLVYQPDWAASALSKDLDNLPDEFFEVTVDDVRKRFAMLKSER